MTSIRMFLRGCIIYCIKNVKLSDSGEYAFAKAKTLTTLLH
ncbi:hypothetical protein NMS_0974 [Nonlabens marinus S1-08]|uniref:Uncharacterized protein n=1 Tax=Nonlabens marinus S1-08 TaxID=1454201 RepID=W8VUY2_9FLAO|nr:hypothetical protein NMS_0974 [Nonlabens marinus S1-08]